MKLYSLIFAYRYEEKWISPVDWNCDLYIVQMYKDFRFFIFPFTLDDYFKIQQRKAKHAKSERPT